MKDFLIHYGVPGMKWGIRRFQNEDGTLTEEGKIRYGKGPMPEKYKTDDIKEDVAKLHKFCKENYQKYRNERGEISISDEIEKSLKDAVQSDSQVVKYTRRMREKQEKYNAALKTLDLNRRINTYQTLNEAQKDWKMATLGAAFRAIKKLPREDQGRAFGWLYLYAPRLVNVIDDDFYS